jgi:uncharacterized coiled-coil DUF342 family protein
MNKKRTLDEQIADLQRRIDEMKPRSHERVEAYAKLKALRTKWLKKKLNFRFRRSTCSRPAA